MWIAEASLKNAGLKWQNRLSFKQARAAVIITLLIGVGFSALQIFWDLHGERNQIDRTVNQVLSTVRESATQAAYGLDESLAERVVSGLFEYDPIYHALIRDDFGNILAQKQRQQSSSSLNWLTSIMFGDNQHYEIPLTVGDSADLVGYLEIDVDTGLIAAGFINRSVVILVSGLVRNFLLGIALTFFFYLTLTKPLLRLVHSLRQVDPGSPATTKVDIPNSHSRDELGLLAHSTNGLLTEIDDNLWRLREAEQTLRERENRLRGIMQNVADGIISIDSDCRILQCNPACLQLLHLPADAELVGHNLLDYIVDASQLNLAEVLARTGNDNNGTSFRPALDRSVELILRCADGNKIRVASVFQPMQLEDNLLYTVVFHDVTAQRRYEERLVYMANHDPLTDLPNRAMLELSLRDALQGCDTLTANSTEGDIPRDIATALLFIDLDRFKLINDSLGHDFGDLLLKEVANRLRDIMRRNDTLGRLGGDEFLIIIPQLSETQEAATLAQTVIDAFSPTFEIRGRQLFVTPSIGIALSPADGDDFATLMRNADAAMYSAKARGGGTYHFFTKMMNESAAARLAMENDLRDAIKREQFEVYYQPKIHLATGRLSGLEALLRWNRPGRGFVSPMQFIPIAEETGLIGKIGEWVLRRVCEQIVEWDAQGVSPVVVAVNLSTRQLIEGRITETVANILHETGVPASRLVLEITETVMLQGMNRAIAILNEIRRLGVQIAIDDFGTGYSSLTYLKRLPINSIKIDRSFIRDITTDPDDAAITNTIILMGRNLGLRVIAEGVETHDQLEFLRAHNCDEVQGFLISEARPPAEIVPLMEQLEQV
ncbi:EAL domain-containing protein [Thalassospira sp. TSL5-1]|uniref:EAL domain-containing protein n=1 Tax=Thalassospira sp. TSL5-1 TaxID=1544451 RepID=UPI00208EE1B0|nr:EAL domain-containing protein [Thalassospira sp. TSL5-1]